MPSIGESLFMLTYILWIWLPVMWAHDFKSWKPMKYWVFGAAVLLGETLFGIVIDHIV